MNKWDIYNAIGDVEDAMLLETQELLEAQPAAPRHRRVWRPVVILAASLCLVVGTAAALTLGMTGISEANIKNPTVVESTEDMQALLSAAEADYQTELVDKEKAVAYSEAGDSTPKSLEEVVQDWTAASENWLSEDSFGGRVALRLDLDWSTLEAYDAEGPLKMRLLSAGDGWTKTEYTAEDPDLFLDVETSYLHFDASWMGKAYTAVAYGNSYFIEKKDDVIQSIYGSALYAAGEDGYVQYEYTYTPYLTNGTSYIIESSYDKVEVYTANNGIEAVIGTKNGNLWVTVQTDHFSLSMYGAYLTVEDAEEILDNLELAAVWEPDEANG